VNVIALPIELQQLAFKVIEHRAKVLFYGVEMYVLKDFSSQLRHEDKMCGEKVDRVSSTVQFHADQPLI